MIHEHLVWNTCCMQHEAMLLREISAFLKDCLVAPGSYCPFPHDSDSGLPSSLQSLYGKLAGVLAVLKPLGQPEREDSPKALPSAQTPAIVLHFLSITGELSRGSGRE